MGELPPDSRPDLRHLLGGAEPVEPRHQRGVQACGDRQGRGRNRGGGAPRFALAFRLQHRLRHFLHEQRNAVGALDDVLPDVRRQRLVAGDAVDHRVDFALRQAINRERGHMRPSDPGRLELRPERHDQQHAKGPNPVHGPTEHFQARGVSPMRILEDHQHRILLRDSASICAMSASSVLCRRCCGSGQARDSVRRSEATASRQEAPRPRCEVEVCASSASSLSSFACGVSSCASPAARSIWPMIG